MRSLYPVTKAAERARTETRDSARWQARRERIGFVMNLCGLSRTHTYSLAFSRAAHLFDHCFTWRHRSGVLRWDDPYRQSRHMQEEPVLRAFGFQVVHLPIEMSLHVRGECQPRLIALPGVDLEHIKRLLMAAQFETPLTREFWAASDELWGKQYGTFARVTGSADVIK